MSQEMPDIPLHVDIAHWCQIPAKSKSLNNLFRRIKTKLTFASFSFLFFFEPFPQTVLKYIRIVHKFIKWNIAFSDYINIRRSFWRIFITPKKLQITPLPIFQNVRLFSQKKNIQKCEEISMMISNINIRRKY